MFKVSPANLQTFIDTPNCVLEDRVQYSTVHIPNVFCDGHLQIISLLYRNRQVCREFLITLYFIQVLMEVVHTKRMEIIFHLGGNLTRTFTQTAVRHICYLVTNIYFCKTQT